MLLLCLIVFCLVGVSPCGAAPTWDTSRSSNIRNKLLLISFDGFRWDYDRDVDTPNLDRMAQDGVKAKHVTPPFLTITSPAHFTLLTGILKRSTTVIVELWDCFIFICLLKKAV
uniref:Ectonucleotide pyrophosphatase/phosphodiesterase 7 n=1 Tax=Labrus bergylta TaxID=56723 RepID=A0A3Q3F1H5_9LABR